MLVFLYSISEAAEGYTEEKTRAAIKALMNLAPKVALVRRDGVEREIPVEELRRRGRVHRQTRPVDGHRW